MQAHKDEKRPKRRQVRRLGHKFVFFFSFSVLLTTKAHSSQQRATQANTGQCRPTKAHEDETGPERCQTRRLGQRCVFSFLFFLCFIDNESLQQPTKANEGQHRLMQAHSRAQGWVYSPPPTTHHHHHHHLTTSSTSSTTITRARDMSRAFSFFLFILFYFILHRGRDASWALVCFILFLFYSFYFTGTEMRLSLFFFFFFFYLTFYFTRAWVQSSNLNQGNFKNQLMFLASFFSE